MGSDLGYFSQEESIIAPNFKDYQVIAVGHSFGVLRLLNYSADLNTNLNNNSNYNFQAIISLQGFRDFLGNKALLNKKTNFDSVQDSGNFGGIF